MTPSPTSQPSTRNVRSLLVRWVVSSLMFAVGLSLTPSASGEGESVRFTKGLRERRLFPLAESYAERRLSESSTGQVERADLLVELLRTFADHALHSNPQDRPALWAKAQARSQEFARLHASNPRRFLVQMQEALGVLAQARLARQEAEVGPAGVDAMEEAKSLTRRAIGLFESLQREVGSEVAKRRRSSGQPSSGELSGDELFALQNNVSLQLGESYRNQALCYPPRSDDRIAALTIALESLAEPLKQLPSGDPLIDRLQLLRASCLRLREDISQSETLLNAVLSNPKAAALHARARAELVRIRLQQRRVQDAMTLAERGGAGDPELEFARLETLATRIKAAGDDKTADPLRKQAIALVSTLEESHGPYWGRRASQLLVRIAGDAEGGAGLEILRRTAETLYLKGEMDEAIEAYAKAAERALALGRPGDAFKHRVTAAMIEQKRERPDEYLNSLRRTAIEMKGYEKAPEAHLAAISACVALARKNRDYFTMYDELLNEHVANWPQADTAHQARMWLGRLRSAQKRWLEAIQAYGAIPDSSDHFGSAVRAVAPCWQAHLARLESRGEDVQQAATQAIRYFESVLPGADVVDTWSELDRVAALQAARTRILFREGESNVAERLLKAALQSSPDADSAWTRTARAWLVVALGAQGKADEAQQWIGTLAGANPSDLFEVVMQLHIIGKTAVQSKARTLLSIEQAGIRALKPKLAQLTPSQRLQLAIYEGETLINSGDIAEARSRLKDLAKQHPRRGDVQEAYASALSAHASTAREAIGQWRIVDAGSSKESERWYRAKYYIALAYFQLGDKKAAASRIRYLQQTSKMDTQLRREFEALLRKCAN